MLTTKMLQDFVTKERNRPPVQRVLVVSPGLYQRALAEGVIEQFEKAADCKVVKAESVEFQGKLDFN